MTFLSADLLKYLVTVETRFKSCLQSSPESRLLSASQSCSDQVSIVASVSGSSREGSASKGAKSRSELTSASCYHPDQLMPDAGSNGKNGAKSDNVSHSQSTIIPLRGYKRAMVKSMAAAGQIPHFHLCDELDMQAMMKLRNRLRDDSVLQGVHLTFLPVMIKV